MIALYIFLALILLFAILLSLYIQIIYDYDGINLKISIGIGPIRFKILPSKNKKVNYRKLSKFLKGKKISTYKHKNKKRDSSKKKYSGIIDSIIKNIKEISKEKDFTSFLLQIIKSMIFEFGHKFHSKIDRLIIHVDAEDAAKTCIKVGAISQTVLYIIEILNVFTKYKPVKNGLIAIIPVFDNSGNRYDINGRFKIRIINIFIIVVSSAFQSMINGIR